MLCVVSIGLRSYSIYANMHYECILTVLMYAIMDIVVFTPTLLRLCYVRRVSKILKSFYSNSDEQLAKLKERNFLIIIMVIIAFITVYEVVSLVISGYPHVYCTCSPFSDAKFLAAYVPGSVSYILEVVAYIYFMIHICALKNQLKYKIKEELLLLSSCWLLMRIITILNITRSRCLSILDYIVY